MTSLLKIGLIGVMTISLVLIDLNGIPRTLCADQSSAAKSEQMLPVVSLGDSDSLPSKNVRVLEVGDQAPDFSLPSLAGEKVTLSAYKDGTVLLWFTNLCGGCQAVLPDVAKIDRDYSRKGVIVLAVSLLGSDTATVGDVIRNQKTTFPFLIDPEGEVYEQYGGVKLPPGTCPANPQLFILDSGKVAFAKHFPGALTDELRGVLDRINDSGKPAPSEHPAEHLGGSSHD